MRRLLVGFFTAIGFLSFLFVIAVVVLITRLQPSAPALPGKIILSLDLTRGLAEGAGEEGLQRLIFGTQPSLRDIVDALEAAQADPRVKGVLARVGSDDTGFAKAQQVRDEITAFRAKGKFAIAFADSFGEFGAGTRPYYLATAFDQIWLQPMGSLGLTGLYAEAMFIRDTLNKLGIAPEFGHKGQFKTAANVLTETQMTPPQREEVEDLLKSISGQVVNGIAQARKLSPEAVTAAIDKAPLLPNEALETKLIDRLGYRDDAIIEAHRRASGAELVGVSAYLDGAGRPHRTGERIALIYGSGLIVRGGGPSNPLTQSDLMAANAITTAFRDAVRDPKVRAILFRIDSPGGSVVASETIWHDVVYARERGKPVIVSMGDVAGSGGYYVAAPADKIVAEPATLTGSIGVLAGKLVIADLLKKIGVSTDAAQFGVNAGMFSATSNFSPLAHARLQAFLDASYKGFKEHVAAGRHMSADAVEAVAQGRVWTGEEAKVKGLVDALGGYGVALRLAKEVANIPADSPVELTVFPRQQGIVAYLYERLTGTQHDDDNSAGANALGRAFEAAQPLVAQAAAALDNSNILLMSPLTQPR
ncbi:MAG: signal peptide peptidase SppA [Alphaproteobacteria bacterium]|nr:signal peptide peptidase SppA [Alphaproteobacteria bacterium]